MKFFGACIVSLMVASASAMAQAIPAGIYSISGTVTKVVGSFCNIRTTDTLSGAMLYPGTQTDKNLIISLQGVTANRFLRLVTLSAFPPVPAAGLNGWTAAAPASPNYTQALNGKITGGGVSALVNFDITALDTTLFPVAQGKINMTVDANGPCTEQFLVTLQYTGAY